MSLPDEMPARINFDLMMPQRVLQAFEEQAEVGKIPLKDLISYRLAKCVNHYAKFPLYFDDKQRQRLEHILGKNYSDVDKLLDDLEQAFKVSIRSEDEHFEVQLSPTLIRRLKSRCFGLPFTEFLKKKVIEGLEQFVGLR